jgi:CheY-like chemotaxis protein
MNFQNYHILLADDDADDCMFFKEALEDLSVSAAISMVNNGLELMNFLEDKIARLPDVLFLDLNMPFKTGAECLAEIKSNEKLKDLPVIIYSTSANQEVIDMLYNRGAQFYVRKPGDFSLLKNVISRALILSKDIANTQPAKDDFFILP